MSISITGDIRSYFADVVRFTEEACDKGLALAAAHFHQEVLEAFKQEGPGWYPLKRITIRKKQIHQAKEPEAILREFNTMRDSIEVRSEGSAKVVPVRGKLIVKKVSLVPKPSGGIAIQIRNVKNIVGFYTVKNYVYSVGLFSDTYLATIMAKPFSASKVDKFQRVNRGIIHEYGGVELQKETSFPIEEVATGRISARALKGQQNVERYGTEVRKRKVGKAGTISRVVRIPSRSFLRMPFDKVEYRLFLMIVMTLSIELSKL